jgi:hypothetical protein
MIDVTAGESQFVDHLAPIWLALPPEHRGDFITTSSLRSRVRWWGIDAVARIDHPERPILVASYGDHKRARRQGRKSIARMEHGAGQSYFGDSRFARSPSYAGGMDAHDVGLFLCPNEYSADKWRTAYPNADVAVVGCAKLDSLPRRDGGGGPSPVVAVSFHFNIPIIPETTWTWLTYRGVMAELAERVTVIGHAHPKGLPMIDRHYRRLGIEIVPDFAEVCRRADLYVCDNSSTLFEFASTGRPVVVLNDPEFRRDINHGGRFWDWATVGLQVDEPSDLVSTVERALTDPRAQQDERERVLDLVYAYRTGAAQRAADALLAWAGVEQKVAA